MRMLRIEFLATTFITLLMFGATCVAQEVAFVDLTIVTQQTDLRHPSATAQDTNSRGGTHAIHECADPDQAKQAELRSTLISLDRAEYDVGGEPRFVVRIENVGSFPIDLPISPHLSELQPVDASDTFAFAYKKMDIDLLLGGATWNSNIGGRVTMYGSIRNPKTMQKLLPGQWLTVIGRGKVVLTRNGLTQAQDPRNVSEANAQVSISDDEISLTPTGSATVSRFVCISNPKGTAIPIRLNATATE